VLAKHSKSFSLIDCISVGVDRMQRNFEPMRKQVEAWQRSELTDVTAKVVIYEPFVGKLEAPKHLARTVRDLYFEPKYEEFKPRTIWSLSNAFTSAFKELDLMPQFEGRLLMQVPIELCGNHLHALMDAKLVALVSATEPISYSHNYMCDFRGEEEAIADCALKELAKYSLAGGH